MQLKKEGCTLTVYLEGDLDHCNAVSVRRLLDGAIQEGDVKKMIVDMQDTAFMDSSGIGVLLGRYKLLRQHDGRMIVRNMNRQVEKVFRLSGLGQIMECE